MNADAVPTMLSLMSEADLASGALPGVTLALRGAPGGEVVPAVRTELSRLVPELTFYNVRTLDQQLDRLVAFAEPFNVMGTALIVFALLLAALGLAAVMTHTVQGRRKEIGIRMALGARTGQVLRLVLSEYAAIVAIGGVLGGAGAVALVQGASASIEALARVLSLGTADTTPLLIAPLLLVAVALIACYAPVRRSTRVDPLRALREE